MKQSVEINPNNIEQNDLNFEIKDSKKTIKDTAKVLEYILKNNLIELPQDEIIDEIEKIYPEYVERYYSVLNIITKKCDIDNLIQMFRAMTEIEKDKNNTKSEITKLQNLLGNKYIPDKLKS